MTDRERLIELLNKLGRNVLKFPTDNYIASLADYLLANGVIALPCKVGDKLYRIWSCGKHGKSISELTITTISMIDNECSWIIKVQSKSGRVYQFDLDDLGNTVYVNKAEVEKALEECRNSDL